jgi:hypothetical protein
MGAAGVGRHDRASAIGQNVERLIFFGDGRRNGLADGLSSRLNDSRLMLSAALARARVAVFRRRF